MQKTRQPSCRLTGFLFFQFLNYILLFLKDPVRRVSSQPNGVVRHVPFLVDTLMPNTINQSGGTPTSIYHHPFR